MPKKEKKNDQAKEKWLKTSFDGSAGEICCIGFDNGSVFGSYGTHNTSGDESQILSAFWDVITDAFNGRCPTLVAHNAKFDLPFLYHRSVINSVKPSYNFQAHGRHGSDHFCTMEEWAGFNGRISQDNLCEILGLPTKPGMTGADVWPEYQKGNIDKIAEYCKYDVETVIKIHKRLTWS